MASITPSEPSTSHASTPAPQHFLSDGTATPAEGSQTSHSPSTSSEAFFNRSHIVSSFPSEATVFLSNLSNFLALGCLTCEEAAEDVVTCNEDIELSEWQDVSVPVHPMEATLSKLIAAGWVRVRKRRSILDAKYIVYRIYILPGDVGLRFLDRESKRLLSAIESLIVNLDINPDTWNGRDRRDGRQA